MIPGRSSDVRLDTAPVLGKPLLCGVGVTTRSLETMVLGHASSGARWIRLSAQ